MNSINLPFCLCRFGFGWMWSSKQVSSFSSLAAITAPLNVKKLPL
jgi:hypothetical protein